MIEFVFATDIHLSLMQRRSYAYDKEEIGVARCPYDPMHNSTAVYVGKQCFLATLLAVDDLRDFANAVQHVTIF